MIKAFAVGAMAAAVIFGSTFGASAQTVSPAQTLSPAQVEVIGACSAASLSADSGARCAIALAALAPGEYAAIRAVVEAGAGTQVALLDGAIASSGVDTGAINGDTRSRPGDSGSPA